MRTAQLVGGLYGVSLGRAFFGESMFHSVRDASKVALVHLVARLKAGQYRLLDTQFVTAHLKTFGAVEVPRPAYHKLLDAALVGEADFAALPTDQPVSGADILKRLERMHDRGEAGSVVGDRRGRRRRQRLNFRRRLTRLGRRCDRRRRACGRKRRSRLRDRAADRLGAIGQPHVIDRMLDRMQAGATPRTSSR